MNTAQDPCHCGPQNSLFLGALLNYGKMTVLQNTQLFNQLNIIYSYHILPTFYL